MSDECRIGRLRETEACYSRRYHHRFPESNASSVAYPRSAGMSASEEENIYGAGLDARAERPGAFTLIELLVVVAIIAALAGILMPVVMAARRHAQETPCSTNLRNHWVALSLYCEDRGGGWPRAPLYLVEIRPYLRCDEVFLCKNDPRPRGQEQYPAVIDWRLSNDYRGELLVPFQVSYHYIRHWPSARSQRGFFAWEWLLRRYPRLGLVACSWHGVLCSPMSAKPPSGYERYHVPNYTGKTLRVRTDGSISADKWSFDLTMGLSGCGRSMEELFDVLRDLPRTRENPIADKDAT